MQPNTDDIIELNAVRYGPIAATKPQQIVVLLHGLGSNAQDLISLAPMFAKELPNCLFVSPNAPFPCDMAPEGYEGSYQWFSLQEWTENAMRKGAEVAKIHVDNFVDNLLKTTGVPEEKLAYVGFSQGAMMSMFVAPRRQKPCAGVLAYSGALLGAKDLKNPFIHKLPTCLIHGFEDNVVPVTAWYQASQELNDAGFPVEGEAIHGLQHGIDEKGISEGLAFLRRTLL